MLKFFAVATLFAAVGHGNAIPKHELDDNLGENLNVPTIESVPWLVSIGHNRIRNDSVFEYYHVCSGGIISADWVITAAHCADDFNDLFPVNTVLSGATNYITSGVAHSILRKVLSPQYKFVPGDLMPLGDIALIQLSAPLSLGASTSPVVAYHRPIASIGGELATASCWGGKNFDERPYNLRADGIKIMGKKECDEYLAREVGHSADISGKLCAYHDFRNPMKTASCEGDSGFPLVMENDLGRDVVAIQSWYPKSCSSVGRPIVFTEVANHYNWIAATIGVSKF